jgi:hypothetical protein
LLQSDFHTVSALGDFMKFTHLMTRMHARPSLWATHNELFFFISVNYKEISVVTNITGFRKY